MVNHSTHIPSKHIPFQIQVAYFANKNQQKALRCILLFSVAVFLRSTGVKHCSSNHTESNAELALAQSFQRKQTNTETEIWLLYWLSSICSLGLKRDALAGPNQVVCVGGGLYSQLQLYLCVPLKSVCSLDCLSREQEPVARNTETHKKRKAGRQKEREKLQLDQNWRNT